MKKTSDGHPSIFAFRGGALTAAHIAFISVLGGCGMTSLAGRDFERPSSNSLSIGKVTEAEILRRYGAPFGTGQFTKHDQLIHSVHYYYATGEFGSRTFYKKHCWFYFAGEKFVGYSFVTGIPSEQVDFDAHKVSLIKKGTTRRNEVIALFGEPTGVFAYPATAEKATEEGDTVVDYDFHRISPDGRAFENKSLRLTFDGMAVVKAVEFDADNNGSAGVIPAQATEDPIRTP